MILTAQKICQLKRTFFVYIKINTFGLFTAEAWGKNGVEVIEKKELKNYGYYLIRTDPDKNDFNDEEYEEFGRVNAYITESIKKQTEKSTKTSLIDDLSKRFLGLEFKSNHSIKSKCLKWFVKKILSKYKK